MIGLGWDKILLLAVVGLIVFGPERLPGVVKDAVQTLRQLRTMASSAASDLKAELGPEIADLDLRSLHPRTMLASVLDDEPAAPAGQPVAPAPVVPAGRSRGPALGLGERPPWDVDAT